MYIMSHPWISQGYVSSPIVYNSVLKTYFVLIPFLYVFDPFKAYTPSL